MGILTEGAMALSMDPERSTKNLESILSQGKNLRWGVYDHHPDGIIVQAWGCDSYGQEWMHVGFCEINWSDCVLLRDAITEGLIRRPIPLPVLSLPDKALDLYFTERSRKE